MQIPEELLILSNKELEKEFSAKTIYQAKWIIYDDAIYKKIKTPLKNKILFQNPINSYINILDNDELQYCTILTLESFFALKKENTKYIVQNWTNDRFGFWLATQTEQLYSKENIDVQITEGYVNLVIYYPELTITNSIELSHILKDVYLRYTFKKDYYGHYLSNIEIARETLHEKEIQQNYIFSHVNSKGCLRYNDAFCYGETTLKRFIQNCKNLEKHPRSYLQQLLLSFEEYLQWESIEGTPYNYIEKVINCKQTQYRVSYSCGLCGSDLKSMVRYILKKKLNLEHEFILSHKYKLKLKQNVIDQIDLLLTNEYSYRYIYSQGHSYEVSGARISDYEGRLTQIVFKGETKKLKVEKENIDIAPSETRVHRYVLNKVIDIIENKLENFIINRKWSQQHLQNQQILEPELNLEELENPFL